MGIFCSTPEASSLSNPSTLEQMMATSFSQEPLVVWCDANIKSAQYQGYISQLRRFCKLSTFSDAQQAINWIAKSKRKFHVITNGEDQEQFQIMHNLENVCSVYLFSQNAENNRELDAAHCKTISIENNPQKIIKLLESHLRYTSTFRLQISLKEVNQNYAKQIPSNPQGDLNSLLSIEPFFKLAKKVFPENPDVEAVELLYRNPEYDKLEIFRKYAQETFLPKIVNNSLTFSLMPEGRNNPCEFMIKDLQQTIREKYQPLSGVFYKTGIMPLDLQLNFQSYLDKDVEIKHFIIANNQKEQILKFAKFSTISPQEIALLTIIVPQLPENIHLAGGIVKLTPDFLEKIDDEEEILFSTCSIFHVIGVNFAENDERAYPQVALLYGFDIINKHLQEKDPEIIIEKIDLFKRACSQCFQQNSEDNLLYLDLCNPERYLCKKCITESIKSCFLCVSPYLYQNSTPDVDKIRGTKLNAMAVSYPPETTVPFYGYTCSGCNKIPEELCFYCINDNKKWCKDCKESCLVKGHEVILETSPYSFWSKGSSKDIQERIVSMENGSDMENDYDYARAVEAEQQRDYNYANRSFENYLTAKKNISHRRRISVLHHLASNSVALDHFDAGENYLLEVLKIITKVYGAKHLKVAEALITLGEFYTSVENYEKAEEKYTEAFEIKLSVETIKLPQNTLIKSLFPIVFRFLKQYPKSTQKQGDILNVFKTLTRTSEKPNFVSFIFALESAYKNNENEEGAKECSQFMSKHILKEEI